MLTPNLREPPILNLPIVRTYCTMFYAFYDFFLSEIAKSGLHIKILSETKIFKRTEHFLIHHLCWVDLLMLTLNGCFNFYSLYERYIKYVNTCWLKDLRNNFAYSFLLFSNWPFGKYYCHISNFISLSTVSASTLTLTAITFQR